MVRFRHANHPQRPGMYIHPDPGQLGASRALYRPTMGHKHLLNKGENIAQKTREKQEPAPSTSGQAGGAPSQGLQVLITG